MHSIRKTKHLLEFELDRSQAPKRRSDNVLIGGNFNHGHGGSTPVVKNTTSTSDSVGPRAHSSVANPGNEMIRTRTENDSSPKGKINTPKHVVHGKEKNHDIPIKELRETMKKLI